MALLPFSMGYFVKILFSKTDVFNIKNWMCYDDREYDRLWP